MLHCKHAMQQYIKGFANNGALVIAKEALSSLDECKMISIHKRRVFGMQILKNSSAYHH
jgi:hypothetical protein